MRKSLVILDGAVKQKKGGEGREGKEGDEEKRKDMLWLYLN
jgi:hypothetical protein